MRYIITTAFLLASLVIFSQTITVKQDGTGDYATIQEAIDNAVDDDVVLVWPGTYYENISYKGKNITVASLNYTTGDPAYIDSTIINGNQNGSCVMLNNDETDCYLQGFTITNGSGTWLYNQKYFGGGLYLLNSNLNIVNCRINNNHVTGFGGGIYCYNSDIDLSGCNISFNSAYHSGGGINIDGLEQSEKSITVYMINCQVTDHRITYFNPNGLFDCGIVVYDAAELFLVNSTVGNNSSEFTLYSGAVEACMGGSIYAYNSILYGNIPYQSTLSGSSGNTQSTLEIYNSLVQYGQQGVHQSGTGHSFYYDPSNIDTDPMWDTMNIFPYCLSPGSPCIDYGTLNLPAGIELPETDLAGNPRIYGSGIDLGAYEYGPWVGDKERELKQIFADKTMIIFPNPATEHINCRFHIPYSILSIWIYDMLGGIVEIVEIPKGLQKVQIDISDYLPGIYIAVLRSNNELVGNEKFIKH